jgi:hypothetical protein
MFNDEIEQVRLRAIESLTAIAKHIQLQVNFSFPAVLGIRARIRICRIRMFLGLPDPDPLVRGTNLGIRIRNKMSRIPNTVLQCTYGL